MAIYRRKIFALAAKIESPSGTDSIPTLATDAIRVVGIPTLTVAVAESGDRANVVHGGLGKVGRAKAAGRTASIDVTIELFGKGSAYTVVPASAADFQCDPFLRGAGFSRSFATAKVTYTTLDTALETFTLYCWDGNGKLFKLVGCTAKPKASYQAGQVATMTFSVEGVLTTNPADASISGLVLPTVIPPIWSDTTCSIGAWSTTTTAPNQLAPRKLDLDFGTATTPRPWAGANAHQGFAVTDRAIKATMEVEAVALSTFDPYARAMEAQDSTAVDTHIATSLVGGTGNTIDLLTGQWALSQPGDLDLGGLAGWTLAGDLVARSIASGLGAGREIAISVS